MDHALQTISYIADIGSVLVLMARRRLARRPASQAPSHKLYKMLCHVFHSEDVSSPAPGVLVGGLALGAELRLASPSSRALLAMLSLQCPPTGPQCWPLSPSPPPKSLALPGSPGDWRPTPEPSRLQALLPPLPSPQRFPKTVAGFTVPRSHRGSTAAWESCPCHGGGRARP